MKSPLIVQISSNGQKIGSLTPQEFMSFSGRVNTFLSEIVNDFNKMKINLGEPERASIELNRS